MSVATAHLSSQHRPLNEANFRQISANGFGESANGYPHAMVWFRNQLYVTATRHVLAMTKTMLDIKQRAHDLVAWPVYVPRNVYDLDFRAQLWRYDPESRRWDKVYTAPMVDGIDGSPAPLSIGFRAMTTYRGESDPHEALYVATSGGHQVPFMHLLRSLDGERFEITARPRPSGDLPAPRAVREFQTFKGRLFTSPVAGSKRGHGNIAGVMTIMTTTDPTKDEWEAACEPHFSEPSNGSVMGMAVFQDHLYAGTLNVAEGFQIWKTDASGEPPFRWTKVISRGAHRGRLNQVAETLWAYGECLYVGSAIQNGGYDLDNRVGPAAPEIIRIYPDDSWELVVGDPRMTPDGLKVPLSGHGPGFSNPLAGYVWQMCEHNGWLYAGTTVRTPFVRFFDWDRLPDTMMKTVADDVDRFVWERGGADLYRTKDGVNWTPVTINGFGNPYNFGVRTMTSTPHGLFVGMANPFGPDVAFAREGRWRYKPNRFAGLQIWLGAPGFSDDTPTERDAAHWTKSRARPSRTSPDDEVDSIAAEFYGGAAFRNVGFWHAHTRDGLSACEDLIAELLAFVPIRDGTVLDIDCAPGATTESLARLFPHDAVTGVVSSRRELDAARALVPEGRFVKRSLPKLKLGTEAFNCVLWVEGPSRSGHPERALREIFKVLRPGGRFLFSDFYHGSHDSGSRPSTRLADPAAYEELLVELGFDRPEIVTTSESCNCFLLRREQFLKIKQLDGIAPGILDAVKQRIGAAIGDADTGLLGAASKPT